MTETLLSASNVILFGRRMADIKIVTPREDYRGPGRRFQADFISDENIDISTWPGNIGGITPRKNQTILLITQSDPKENGLYALDESWNELTSTLERKLVRVPGADKKSDYAEGVVVTASIGNDELLDGRTYFARRDDVDVDVEPIVFARPPRNRRHNPFAGPRMGGNRSLEDNLLKMHQPIFARVYGFSYDGRYYELPNPTIFLVHGAGELASGVNSDPQNPAGAKAPGDPSISGMSAADFQFSDELRAWSYDRADYTLRMDMESGMFEQVLLEPHFGGGMGLSGAKLSGAKVSGAKVSGAKVSGAKVSGAKLSGAGD